MTQAFARSTPARLTAPAAAKLPRLLLLAVGLVYIFSGLFFRDPWKTDDVAGLATMVTALGGAENAWWLPQIGQLAHAQNGPLITWVGSVCIIIFAPFFEIFTDTQQAVFLASRLPNFLWFGLMASALWYGTYLLGRRPEPQPVALPFGGEPTVRDYGRMIADAALLLALATVGIIWRLHETSEVPALIAMYAVAFYALARILDHRLSGAITLGCALGGAFLARGWIGALPLMVACLVLFLPRAPLWAARSYLPLISIITGALILVWLLPAYQLDSYWIQHWWHWNGSAFAWPSLSKVFNTLRYLAWFLWPTWPFALLALWRWRAWLLAPHICIPTTLIAAALIFLAIQADPFEPEFSLLAVPCAALAAFALPTLRRGVVNSLDWFAVMCFSLTAATVWLGWFALQTGWPHQISRNIARQTQGYEAFISWPAVSLAVLGTIAWITLVYWRLNTRPAALWRGTVLSAGGLITTWLLLVTLWMPALDYARSYRDVSAQLANTLALHQKKHECLRSDSLGLGQRASLLVFNNIDFSFDPNCTLVLQQASPDTKPFLSVKPNKSAALLWEGKREADRREIFRLFRVQNIDKP
ncbi:MAG TPA: glycosyltransferase [Burkholderiaceae bacterium]|nr:glycosyltransferase [Burkholderiaceae bacterium]